MATRTGAVVILVVVVLLGAIWAGARRSRTPSEALPLGPDQSIPLADTKAVMESLAAPTLHNEVIALGPVVWRIYGHNEYP